MSETKVVEKIPRVVETKALADKRRAECKKKALGENPNAIENALAEIDKIASSDDAPRACVLLVGEGALREAVLDALSSEGYAVKRIEKDKIEVYWG